MWLHTETHAWQVRHSEGCDRTGFSFRIPAGYCAEQRPQEVQFVETCLFQNANRENSPNKAPAGQKQRHQKRGLALSSTMRTNQNAPTNHEV
ncbi:hypothetical protein Bwad001_19320 [Bilophila wadsworthia]